MKHFRKHLAAGRRLALERCEPRRLLSATTFSTEDLGEVPGGILAWQGTFDLSAASGLATDTAVVANSFLPTPVGAGLVTIDTDSDLVTLGAQPRSYGDGLSLGLNAGGSRSILLSGGFAGSDVAHGSIAFGDFDLAPTVIVDDGFSVPGQPFDDTDVTVTPDAGVLVPPAAVDDTPSVQPPQASARGPLTDAQRAANEAYFRSGPSVAPMRSFDAASVGNDGDQLSLSNTDDWFDVPGTGSVVPPLEGGETTNGFDSNAVTPPPASTNNVDPRPEGEKRGEGPVVVDEDQRNGVAAPTAASGHAAVERLAFRTVPPAGSNDVGAGAIDLTELLFAEDASNATQGGGAIAHTRAPETHEHIARDAALAVESWVRAIPSPATPMTTGNAARPNAEAAAPAIGAVPSARQPVGSVTISIDGDRLSRADASTGNQVSSEREKAVPETSAAARIERPNAYRYALSALSALLGGAVVSVARGRGSDVGAGRKPAVVGRSRPGEAGREIRPSCE